MEKYEKFYQGGFFNFCFEPGLKSVTGGLLITAFLLKNLRHILKIIELASTIARNTSAIKIVDDNLGYHGKIANLLASGSFRIQKCNLR